MHQKTSSIFAPADERGRELPMRAMAVCVGKPALLEGNEEPTGIHKRPCDGPVEVGEMGLKDDAVLNLIHHGGRDQAVYAFGSLDISHWEEQLGHELEPGFMGENLVIENMDTHNVYVGDRFVFPNAVLEATCPRIPCATFAAQMNDKQWVKKFYASGHMGVYFRVLETGSISAGESIKLDMSNTESMRILDLA